MIHGCTIGVLLTLSGCSTSGDGNGQRPQTPSGAQPASPQAVDARPVILFLGTSLTAGLGVDPDSAYPALIQRRLDSLHLAWRAENAGVSGETSAGARRRLPWLLQGPVAILVLETGANDGLRGLDPDSTRANVEAIVARVRANDSTTRLVLVGMASPPNMGPRFTSRFRALYPEIARHEHLAFVPFLLAGVAGVDSLNQADGIHPNGRGHRIVAENVWRLLGPMVRGRGRAGGQAVGSRAPRPPRAGAP